MRNPACFVTILCVFLGPGLVEAGVSSFDPKWRSCKAASGCVVIPGVCGEWICVGAKFQKEVEAHQNQVGPLVECMPPAAPNPAPKAKCVAKQCVCEKR